LRRFDGNEGKVSFGFFPDLAVGEDPAKFEGKVIPF